MADNSHTRQRSGSPTGNSDAAAPSVSSPPATEIGGAPAVWQGGDIASTQAPNAAPFQTGRLWYPLVVTIAQGQTVNFDAGAFVERWYVTQTSGVSCSVFALPNGAGVGLPLFGAGVTLHLPIANPTISVQNTGTGTVTIAAIAIAGYDPIEGLGYITASAGSGGGGGGNVTVVGPVDGSGFVQISVENFPVSQTVNGTVAISGTVPVSGTFWQATQPVSGTFWQATQPVSIASTVAVDQAPPTTIANGQTNIAVTNTAVQLASNVLGLGMVTIYADATNAANVVIGASGVTTGTGLILGAGKAAVVAASNTNLLYVNGTAGDGISWIAS